jgi:FixJ family two-component response regulator
VLEVAVEFNRRLPVVVVARQLEMSCYLEAMQLGAVDYLAGPLGGEEMARVMRTWGPRCKGVNAERTLGSITQKPMVP